MNKRPIKWNDLLDEYVMKKCSAGESLESVAAAIGCSREGIRQRYARLVAMYGLPKKPRGRQAA